MFHSFYVNSEHRDYLRFLWFKDNYSCMAHAGPNPDHGYTSFDNIGWSLLMALQILTMDYWENLYEKVIESIYI